MQRYKEKNHPKLEKFVEEYETADETVNVLCTKDPKVIFDAIVVQAKVLHGAYILLYLGVQSRDKEFLNFIEDVKFSLITLLYQYSKYVLECPQKNEELSRHKVDSSRSH